MYVAAMKPEQPGMFYEEGLNLLPCSKSWELLLWGFQVGSAPHPLLNTVLMHSITQSTCQPMASPKAPQARNASTSAWHIILAQGMWLQQAGMPAARV